MGILVRRSRRLRAQRVRVLDRLADLRQEARFALALGKPEFVLEPRLGLAEQPLGRGAEARDELQARSRVDRGPACRLASTPWAPAPLARALAERAVGDLGRGGDNLEGELGGAAQLLRLPHGLGLPARLEALQMIAWRLHGRLRMSFSRHRRAWPGDPGASVATSESGWPGRAR